MSCGRHSALLMAALVASTAAMAQTSLLEFVRSPESSLGAGDKATRTGSVPDAPQAREQEIRSQLHGRGITAIREWRLEGDVYRARAEWFGEPVDLHVDAATGDIKQPERLKGAQIETMLKVQGWRDVREVKRSGDTFQVRAERDSQIYDLKIDSKTGAIVEWRPA